MKFVFARAPLSGRALLDLADRIETTTDLDEIAEIEATLLGAFVGVKDPDAKRFYGAGHTRGIVSVEYEGFGNADTVMAFVKRLAFRVEDCGWGMRNEAWSAGVSLSAGYGWGASGSSGGKGHTQPIGPMRALLAAALRAFVLLRAGLVSEGLVASQGFDEVPDGWGSSRRKPG